LKVGSISLEGLDFFAYHGVYAEENSLGNRYTIDVTVHYDFSLAAQTDNLEGTINYENIYRIVKDILSNQAQLLEFLGQQIVDNLFEEFESLQKVEVWVTKHNPAVGGLCRAAKIYLCQDKE